MREDSCPDTTAEQLQAVPSHDSLHRLETQIAALSTETASLRAAAPTPEPLQSLTQPGQRGWSTT